MRYLLLLSFVFMTGCSFIEKGDFKYWRVGSQEIAGFEATRLDDGSWEVKFDHQKSDAAAIAKAAVEGAVGALK